MVRRMILFIVLAICCTPVCFSQIVVKGTVIDEASIPVSFCSIAINGTGYGSLANEDGAFSIRAEPGDTLIFYAFGYDQLRISAAELRQKPIVKLTTSVKKLAEVVVHGEDEYAYELMHAARKAMVKAKAHWSKAYFHVQTHRSGEAVEMLEAYYNAQIAGNGIRELNLKNGRVGLVKYDDRYFISFNTSKAVSMLSLTGKQEQFPVIPLQYTRQALRKRFSIRRLSEDTESYHLYFEPRSARRSCFSGDIWIDKKTLKIQKMTLVCRDASRHPFVAFGEDSIKSVSFDIACNFGKSGTIDLINFTYSFTHISSRAKDSTGALLTARAERPITTKGLMYLFDVGDPFILPYYEYREDYSDYRKISLLPYDTTFWQNAPGLVYTEEQSRTLEFIESMGHLVNFKSGRFTDTNRRGLFETNNFEWTAERRINYVRNVAYESIDMKPQISVQIYLDVNKAGDSLQHFSATIFDGLNTYLPEPVSERDKCIMNICFDIYEIERRKMEEILRRGGLTLSQIESVYDESVQHARKECRRFRYEVAGTNGEEALKRWNNYCLKQVGFDNMKIFNLAGKEIK